MFSEVRWFVYEAGHHCVDHTIARFGEDALNDPLTEDNEGNPISACFVWDDCDDGYCDECLYEEVQARWAKEQTDVVR